MGSTPKNGEPIFINGAFYVNTTIMRFVVASAAEAELGALFQNCQDGIIFRLTLSNLGHPQPKNTGPLQQCNCSRYSIQHGQMTEI
jgi:hypothetical protein